MSLPAPMEENQPNQDQSAEEFPLSDDKNIASPAADENTTPDTAPSAMKLTNELQENLDEPNPEATQPVESDTPASRETKAPLSTSKTAQPPSPEDVAEHGLDALEERELLEMFLQMPPIEATEIETATEPVNPLLEITPEIEAQVLSHIDMVGLLTTLNDWVSIPSLDGTAEENLVQEKVAETMRELGLEVETWEFSYDGLRDHPAFSVEVERPRSLGVVGKLGTGNGRSLILNGHTDVVPAGDVEQWSVPPWQVTVDHESGRVYGRGALDMKGNLACAVYAAKAVLDAGLTLNGRVMIQSVVGEEDGGVGTLAAVVRGYKADAAIVLEPTELMIAPAQAGALNFRVTIPGYPAHGAMRSEGVDPLEKFLLVYQAILAFEKVRNAHVDHPMFTAYDLPYPICVGTIHGGNWASTVAESLTFEGRLGIAVDEKPAEARQKFEQLIAQTAQADPWLRDHPPTVEWWGGQFAPAAIRTNHPIIKTLADAYTKITNQEPTLQGMPYGADMRLLVNEGNIPTILFGAGDVRRAHQFDEFVPLDELETVVKTIALTILHFCGVQAPSMD